MGLGFEQYGSDGVGRDVDSPREAAVVQTPTKVIGLSKEELGGAVITEISGGEHSTLFLASNGNVYACGSSNDGRLGLADTDPASRTDSSMISCPSPCW